MRQKCLRDELGPIIDLNRTRCPAQACQTADNRGDLLALDALIDLDRQSFTREGVDDRQGAQSAAVEERVGDEIHRPALVRPERGRLTLALCCADVPARPLEP